MSRIPPVDRNTTTDNVRKTFDAIQKRLGMVPNMMRTMAQSPQVLEGYLGLSGALSRGALSGQLQEQIALAVAEVNACDYCLSAHSALGRGAGLSDEQLEASSAGRASDPKASAVPRRPETPGARSRYGRSPSRCPRSIRQNRRSSTTR